MKIRLAALMALILLTSCVGHKTRNDAVDIPLPASSGQSTRTDLENKLATRLLNLAAQDINQTTATNRYAVIQKHHNKLSRSIDFNLLNENNKLQLRVLNYLLQTEELKSTTSDLVTEENYRAALKIYTSIDVDLQVFLKTAAQELEAVHKKILHLAASDLTIQETMNGVRQDQRNYLNNTESGRQQYLNQMANHLLKVRQILPQLFSLIHNNELNLDGDDHGDYPPFHFSPFNYSPETNSIMLDLNTMGNLPIFDTENIALYLGPPGLHSLNSIPSVPAMQSLLDLPGYTHGWAAYITNALFELPEYKSAALTRAYFQCLIVSLAIADTGIHARNWTMARAVKFVSDNTPYPQSRIEKHLGLSAQQPGVLAATLIGQQAFSRLRDETKNSHQENFNPVKFHNLILASGPLPFHELRRIMATAHAD